MLPSMEHDKRDSSFQGFRQFLSFLLPKKVKTIYKVHQGDWDVVSKDR